ncbi:hypothetical protein AHMF7605_24325 [Adhaeribacter arboris]|uniref:Uncharacterized protein n=1 Tax=Adhaeribacter arboris TaxID=2072846 RepID=A0A2T2YLL5_9BACT|nr:EMI domain-containing protein [Adhaeribacter arboris]PSR56401.1 hypothetical protein AHMF7605_24325 [Adhaeribacter arboris]
MDKVESASKTRYGRDSDRLWEESPSCPEYRIQYKIAYRSKYLNAYKEPVFYKKPEEPNRVLPKISSDGPGFFNAYPGGLNIDPRTGEIDVNDSDAGVRYTVEFSPCGRDCVARTHVVISGIGYEGGIFSLTESPPEALIISPFYFGSTSPEEEVRSDKVPARPAPAGEFGIYPEPNQKPTADLLGLLLDPKTGTIDLRKTIESGALGFRQDPNNPNDRFPENGVSKDFTIFYRLFSGPGKEVLNKSKIRIHFYDTEADIPEELKVRIRQQNNSIYQQGLPLLLSLGLTSLPDTSWEVLIALLATFSSFFFLMARAKDSNHPLIPPEICIRR